MDSIQSGFDTEGAEGTKIAEKYCTEQRDSRTERIIGVGIKVHRRLGRGLLERVYAECLCCELRNSGISYTREVPLTVIYEDMRLNPAYRADIVVEGEVVLEIKSIERILPVHEAQALTYLRLSGCKVGLLMKSNSVVLKDGPRLASWRRDTSSVPLGRRSQRGRGGIRHRGRRGTKIVE